MSRKVQAFGVVGNLLKKIKGSSEKEGKRRLSEISLGEAEGVLNVQKFGQRATWQAFAHQGRVKEAKGKKKKACLHAAELVRSAKKEDGR